MSDALLTPETKSSTDDATTQGEAAQADKQPAPEKQPQAEEQAAEPTTKPAESLYPEKPEGDSEIKPEESKEDDKGEEKTEEQPEGAPEAYEAWTVPEGMPEDFELDEDVSKAFGEVSRELDLSQEKAQSLLNKVVPVWHRRAQEQAEALDAKWFQEIKTDKELGGRSFEESRSLARKAAETYGDDSLQELLNGPARNHPGLFRLLVNIGKDVSEDKFVGGDAVAKSVDYSDDASVGAKLYAKSKK